MEPSVQRVSKQEKEKPMEMAGIREASARTITDVLTRRKEKEVGKQVLRAAGQQKEGLDSKEHTSDHSTEIQGQSHHPDNTIQAPYFDRQPLRSQANLTQCQALFNLYGLPEAFFHPFEHVKLSPQVRPRYRLFLLRGIPLHRLFIGLPPTRPLLRSQLKHQLLLSGYPFLIGYPPPFSITVPSTLPS